MNAISIAAAGAAVAVAVAALAAGASEGPASAPAAGAPATAVMDAYKALAEKMASGRPVTIVYLGGSITVGGMTNPRKGTAPDGREYDYTSYQQDRDSWRALSFAALRKRFEKRPGQFKMIHAAIGGTGSELGAYRLADNVLAHKPDLLFVEFAVNDLGQARLSEDPSADTSVQRTLQSIIGQTRRRDERTAIFMPITSIRDYKTDQSEFRTNLDLSRKHYRRVACHLRVPFVDITRAYYDLPLPEGVKRELLYDGPISPGNRVHPSPHGHKALAAAVVATIAPIIETGRFDFPPAEPLPKLADFPVRPRIYGPRDIPPADGWQARRNEESKSGTPVFGDAEALYATRPGARLRLPFHGTAVSLWWEWVYGRQSGPLGKVEVRLDGKSVGVYADPDNRKRGEAGLNRYVRIATGLDAGVEHMLEIVVPADQPLKEGEQLRLALHGVCVDEGK